MPAEGYISTGEPFFDEFLGGGLETDTLTQFYGAAGTGKTNICLIQTVQCVKAGRKAVFIDSEGVSLTRLEQISGDEFNDVVEGIIFFRPTSLVEQAKNVEKAVNMAMTHDDIGLVVLDSASIYYRLDVTGDSNQRRSLLNQILSLLTLSRRKGIPTIVTNQVYTNIERDTFEPVGGYILRHNAKTIIQLERLGINLRKATVMKHRCLPEGRSVDFRITATGIEEIGR